ncbi:hypothetical protein [Burkholderia sp. Ac-20365]|uniref:hypothetical protein n=1 Tax=Burkholderia sp. Ac-20365 TaxID=2703897 RepID=UPI00197B07D2|nr:hypothetical protein [Burkholderia sp. Ac-20365]MBN3761137.1 hypothetical protein [Burkholderia sp. Ac-20365]
MLVELRDRIFKKLGLRINLQRGDVLEALSRAFDGAEVAPTDEPWVLRVATTPVREVNVTEEWLSRYVQSGRFSRHDLEDYFRRQKLRHHWVDFGDGTLRFLIDGN